MRLGRREREDLKKALAGALRVGGAAAKAAKRVLLRIEPKPVPPPPGQVSLWHPETGTPWQRLPISANVVCVPFTPPGAEHLTVIPVRCCLARQAATWPGRNRKKDGSSVAKRAAIHDKCATCTLGPFYLDAVRREDPDYALPKYKTYRPDSHEQHVERRKFIRSNLDIVPSIDAPPGSVDRRRAAVLEDLEDDDDLKQILDG